MLKLLGLGPVPAVVRAGVGLALVAAGLLLHARTATVIGVVVLGTFALAGALDPPRPDERRDGRGAGGRDARRR